MPSATAPTLPVAFQVRALTDSLQERATPFAKTGLGPVGVLLLAARSEEKPETGT